MNTSARIGPEILIVDDDASLARSYENTLRDEGFEKVVRCTDSREAPRILAERPIGVTVLDLSMPHLSGQEILEIIRRRYPWVIVVIATAVTEIETAVACMKAGALDYLVKPIDKSKLVATVRHALEVFALRRENAELKDRLLRRKVRHPEAFSSLLTQDERMIAIFMYAESVAGSPEPVLITGETGVGKDLLARAIHEVSARSGEFVSVNVAGIDEHVFSDTLFGHTRGAFTGADSARSGLVERAAGGTLLLDEVGDLDPASQVKLLRFLHDGMYFPLGSDNPRRSNVRIIAVTNRNLAELVKTGTFRDDLFYRLQGHHIRIPPLRERLRDIAILVGHFVDEASAALRKSTPEIPQETVAMLEQYSFPGNVRELRSLIFDAVARTEGGRLDPGCFGNLKDQLKESSAEKAAATVFFGAKLPTIREASLQLVQEALRRTGYNQGTAARLMGVSRQTLNRYCKILGIRESSQI